MRLQKYLINELSSEYGRGISFIDADETLFHTFSKIYVVDDKTGKVVKKLDNQEFNTYELPPGHHYDFREFRDATTFRKTSIPIDRTVKRLKRMFQNIDYRGSEVVLLTARGTFDNMKEFRQTFKDYNLPIGKMKVEFVGDRPDHKNVTISQAKKKVVLRYLSTGNYRRCRLIDDDLTNVQNFLSIQNELPQSIINKVKEKHDIPEDEDFPVISFYGLLVLPNGKLKRIS